MKFQFIDLKQKGMSQGELSAVIRAVGGIDKLLDKSCKDQEALALITYINEDAKIGHLLENQQVIKTPVVRNGNKATLGYVPEVWKTWE